MLYLLVLEYVHVYRYTRTGTGSYQYCNIAGTRRVGTRVPVLQYRYRGHKCTRMMIQRDACMGLWPYLLSTVVGIAMPVHVYYLLFFFYYFFFYLFIFLILKNKK